MFYFTLCMKTDAYFNDVFELYTVKHKLLRFTIPHLVADSTWSNRIVSLDTCIFYDERSLGNKLNIPWLLVYIGEGRKTWTINWHVSPSHGENGGRLKLRWGEDLFQTLLFKGCDLAATAGLRNPGTLCTLPTFTQPSHELRLCVS